MMVYFNDVNDEGYILNDDGSYSWKSNAERSKEEDIFIPSIYLDAPNAAICGGRLKPSLDGYKMEVWGSFEICNSEGKTVTDTTGNYLGYVTSGLPDKNGNPTNAPGIGMVVEGYGALKVTKDNIGLQYGGSEVSGGSGFISISSQALTISTANTEQIAIYGTNIYLDETAFEIKGIGPEKQKGIYARFA